MRVEKTYYAFDETEFNDEESCLAYEQEVRAKLGAAKFFDDERKPVDAVKEGTGSVYFVRIEDKDKAPEFFSWLCQYCGFDYPVGDYENGDIFVYDCDHEDWVNLNEQLRWTQKMIAEFNKGGGESCAAEGSNQAD